MVAMADTLSIIRFFISQRDAAGPICTRIFSPQTLPRIALRLTGLALLV
jgi:hypothetical protein